MDIATIAFKADLRELKDAQKELKQLVTEGKKTEKATDKVSSSFTSMGGAAKKVAVGVAAMGAALGVAFAVVGKKALTMASDMEETQGKFDVVFRGLTEQAEAWSQTLVDGYAMSNVESKKYLSNLQDLIVPTGMARDAAGELSNEFVKAAADLGSFNNLPTEKVIQDIQSALAGSAETMLKYGIDVKVAAVQQEVLNMGLAKSKKDITKAHKVQAIYNIMMREGSDATGDMARTQGSYANQLKKLQANVDNLWVSIGQKLLPKATELIAEFNKWWEINKKLVTQDIANLFDRVATGAGRAYRATQILVDKFMLFDNQLAIIGKRTDIEGLVYQLGVAEKVAKKLTKGGIFGQGKGNTAQIEVATVKVELWREALEKARDELGRLERGEPLKPIQAALGYTSEVAGGVTVAVKTMNDTIVAGAKESGLAIQTEVITSLEMNEQAVKELYEFEKGIRDKEIRENTKAAGQINDVWLDHFQGKKDAAERGLELENEILVATEEANTETAGAMTELWNTFAGDTETVFRTVIGDGLRGEFDSLGDAWKSFTDTMVSAFLGAVAQMAAQNLASAIFGDSSQKSGSGSSGGDTNWIAAGVSAVGSYFGFAEGGQHAGGWRLVGERGPELEYTGSSQIFSNKDSANMLGGGGLASDFEILELNNRYLREGGRYTEDLSGLTKDNTDILDDHLNGVVDLDDTTRTATETTAAATEVATVGIEATNSGIEAEHENTGAIGGLTESMGSFGSTISGVMDGMRSMSAMQKVGVAVTTAINPALGLLTAVGVGIYNYEPKEEETKGTTASNEATEPGYEGLGGYEGIGRGGDIGPGAGQGQDVDPGGSSGGPGAGQGDTDSSDGPGAGQGYATGGIVSNLLVPNGDDGYGALSLGEGVLDKNTMSVLSDSIQKGTFNQTDRGLAEELKNIRALLSQVGVVLGKNTAKTAKLLRNFEERGISIRT